ncbi:hypothetical protein DFQ00_103125 [Paenibacillus barcinonensis]|uniref:Uncharacterized protein n=1 Tax=Paenibacillus barcinonensis TaxID=198119 RepID=A0A2V4VBM5_PAEBA|nr:hypothetical protein DFQ00_103125 [Paenibacillus barcinonensis]
MKHMTNQQAHIDVEIRELQNGWLAMDMVMNQRSSLMPRGLSYIMVRIIHTEQVMNEELSYTWL